MLEMNTVFWYDLETFGNVPHNARIAQVAGVRTNLELEEIEPPLNFLVKLSDDWLADPISSAITGITPQRCFEQGLDEAEGLQKLLHEITQKGTILAGYNSSRFDDVIVSFSNYRNGLEPYPVSVKYQNSRWDLIDVLRLAYGIRPQGIEWPLNQENNVSFRLEDLARANGISQDKAHDALWDVKATIGLAKKLKQAQPKLFEYLIQGATSESMLAKRLDYDLFEGDFHQNSQPVVWGSGSASAENKRCFVVLPLAKQHQMKKHIVTWDLRNDPSVLDDIGVEEIYERMFSTNAELKQKNLTRLNVPVLKLNKAPAFALAMPVLEQQGVCDWLNISLDMAYENMELWNENMHRWLPKLLATFSLGNMHESDDVDLQLYSGFIGDVDRNELSRGHALGWDNSEVQQLNFSDLRLKKIWARTRARNGYQFLRDNEKAYWKLFVKKQLLREDRGRTSVKHYHALCESALQSYPNASNSMSDLIKYFKILTEKYEVDI